MKRVLASLSIGDTLAGRVEELLPGDEVLICFDGDLVRVQNETRQALKAGDTVNVIVRALDPLRFQLQTQAGRIRRHGHIDVNA